MSWLYIPLVFQEKTVETFKNIQMLWGIFGSFPCTRLICLGFLAFPGPGDRICRENKFATAGWFIGSIQYFFLMWGPYADHISYSGDNLTINQLYVLNWWLTGNRVLLGPISFQLGQVSQWPESWLVPGMSHPLSNSKHIMIKGDSSTMDRTPLSTKKKRKKHTFW